MDNVKKIIIIILVGIVITITFYSQFNSLFDDIETMVKSKEAQINRYLDLSKGFIELITIYGNNFFKNGEISESELYDLLSNDTDANMYHLDAVEGTQYQKIAGNLTGLGTIPQDGAQKNEIILALQMNQHFNSIYNKLPDVAWLYYTSINNFIILYPWVSSDDFAFSEVIYDERFYTDVTPDKNPLRESIWTPVYLDHAGKGLMVTLSSPIYDEDTFMGAVSLDITNNQLSEMIQSQYEIYIIDDTNSVLAGSQDMDFDNEIIKIADLLNISQDNIDTIKELENNTAHNYGKYIIYTSGFTNAPWTMIFRVSTWTIAGRTALFTLPVLVICILLLFTFFEMEKRKKTEVLLSNSLKELTSYQKLLENAAKYDFLTSTINRRGLKEIYSETLGGNGKNAASVSFIMGDIDCFKQFNDTYGHAAGDKVLQEIAIIMQEKIRSDEVVCRWGGEEFVIMLLNRTYDEALRIAETIRKDIESKIIPWEKSVELTATMTFGVAEHDGDDLIEKSISNADSALYRGKEMGRNQVVGYRSCINKG